MRPIKRMTLFVPSTPMVVALVVLTALLPLRAMGQTGPAVGPNVWEPVGPQVATIFSIERDPVFNEILYVGAHFGGLHRSDDFGQNWTHITTDFSNDIVYAIEIVGTTPRTIYVATQDGGIYKSTDGGAVWQQKNTGLTSTTLRDIEANPFNNQVLLTGSFQGVFRSVDGGETWAPVMSTEPFFPGIQFVWDPVQAGVVYAATPGLGVFRSTDAGVNWAPFTQGIGERIMTSIVWDLNNPNRLFATSADGIFVLDRGATLWRDIRRDFLTTARISHVTTVPNDNRIFASSPLGIFTLPADSIDLPPPDPLPGWTLWHDVEGRFLEPDRTGTILHIAHFVQKFEFTVDGGLSFFSATPGIQNAFSGALAAIQDVGNRILYVGTGANIRSAGAPLALCCMGDADGNGTRDSADLALILSFWNTPGPVGTNGDANWDGLRNSADLASTLSLWGQPCDPLPPPAGASADGDLNWRSQFETDGAIFDLLLDLTNPGVLYAGSEGDGVFKTTNFGVDWAPASDGLVPHDIIAIDQSLHDTDVYYAATGAGIYVSTDGGVTWEDRFQQVIPSRLTALEADPLFDGWVYYANSEGRVFRSTDKGEIFIPTWQAPAGESLIQLKATPFFSIYAVGATGAFYSSPDRGDNFSPIGAPDLQHDVLSVDAVNDAPEVVYVGTNAGGVYRSDTAGGTFEQRNQGIDIPFIFAIAVDQSLPSTVYAGSVGTVYKTNNEGLQWTSHSIGLPANGFVRQLVVDPNDSTQIYAGVIDRPQEFPPNPPGTGVYRSTDSGLTWTRISSDTDFGFAGGLHVSRNAPSVVLAGAKLAGLFRTSNAGATWTSSSDAMSLIVLSITIDPTNSDILYAATISSGVFKSTNAGQNWRHVGIENDVVFHITVDPNNPARLYASTVRGPMRSFDAGSSWVLAGQDNPFVTTITSDPRDQSTLYLGGFDGDFYRSEDDGRTWTRATKGLPPFNIFVCAVDPNDGTVYVGVDTVGVFRSSDGGANWWSGNNAPFTDKTIVSMAVDPGSGDLYVGQIGELYKSTDRGDSFQLLNTGITGDFPGSIVIVPIDASDASKSSIMPIGGSPSVIFVALLNEQGPGADAGIPVILSWDSGQIWAPSTMGITGTDASTIVAVGKGADATLFITTDSGVLRSTDLGASWTLTASAPPSRIKRMIARDTTPVTLFATTDTGSFRSTNAGNTWTPLQLPTDAPAPVPFRLALGKGDGLYIGTTARGLYFSDDAGDTWGGGVTQETSVMVPHAMAVHPLDPDTLIAGTGFLGVAISNDAGVTWRLSNQGLGASRIFTLQIDPVNTDLIYATSSDAGVWFSMDRGETWSPLNDGLYNEFVTSFAIDPLDHNIIYAGTEGGGVFRLRRK